MIETLPSKGSEIKRFDSNSVLFDVLGKMINRQPSGYIDFDGNNHDGFYLYPQEVIRHLERFLKTRGENGTSTRTIASTQRIIDKGYVALHGTDRISADRKTTALKTLTNLCNTEKDCLRQQYQRGEITRKEFQSKIEPVLGISLGVLYKTDPDRFDAILKPYRKNKH